MGHSTVLLRIFCSVKILLPLPKYTKIYHKYWSKPAKHYSTKWRTDFTAVCKWCYFDVDTDTSILQGEELSVSPLNAQSYEFWNVRNLQNILVSLKKTNEDCVTGV